MLFLTQLCSAFHASLKPLQAILDHLDFFHLVDLLKHRLSAACRRERSLLHWCHAVVSIEFLAAVGCTNEQVLIAAIHMHVSVWLCAALLQKLDTAFANQACSLLTFLKLITLLLLDVLVLCLLAFLVQDLLFMSLLVIVSLDLTLLFRTLTHLFLTLELFIELLFHVTILLLCVEMLLLEDHLPAALGSLMLGSSIEVSVKFW